MKTTLNIIKSKSPCAVGWAKLLKYLNKPKADDEPLSLETILKSNGIEDAIWALRCFEYREYCLFSAEVAESVLPIFEKRSPKDDRPRKAIESIRSFHEGSITEKELKAAAAAATAAAAAYDAAVATADAYDAADAYAAAAAAADAAYAAAVATAAADAAYAAAYAAYDAAYDADAADAYATYDADAAAYARKSKWTEIEQLFIGHFITKYADKLEKNK